MKKIIIIILVNFFFVNIAVLSHAKNNNMIIAKVENKIISNLDLKSKILSTLILSNKVINQENINKIKSQSLELLVNYQIKKIELSRFNYQVNPAQLNSYLNSISSNNINKLKDTFKKNNVDFEIFLDEVNTEFKWQKYIYQKYSDNIVIDDNIIKEEIEKQLNNFSVPEYKLSKIEIILANNSTDSAKINQVMNHIKNFGFEDALKIYDPDSFVNNNELIWINSKSLSKEVYNAVLNLKIGQTSQIIKSQESALILKLIDKKQTKVSKDEIEKLKKNIISQKKNELFDLYSSSYLSKIKSSSYIIYK